MPAPADEDSNKAVLVGTLPFPPASTLPSAEPGSARSCRARRPGRVDAPHAELDRAVAVAQERRRRAAGQRRRLEAGGGAQGRQAAPRPDGGDGARAAADPKIEVSVEHAEALMPHDEQGRMLPLGCPLGCFQVFGSGVFVYMAWMQHMRGVFGMAFLFSLPNLVYNWLGNEIEKASWLNVHTIGNVTSINATSESPAAQPARRPTRRRPPARPPRARLLLKPHHTPSQVRRGRGARAAAAHARPLPRPRGRAAHVGDDAAGRRQRDGGGAHGDARGAAGVVLEPRAHMESCAGTWSGGAPSRTRSSPRTSAR